MSPARTKISRLAGEVPPDYWAVPAEASHDDILSELQPRPDS